LLEQALEDTQHERFSARLLTACAWFELQINLDPHVRTSTFKNVGLGYMHLVKSASDIPLNIPRVLSLSSWALGHDSACDKQIQKYPNASYLKASRNLLVDNSGDGWKNWCSNRFLWSWGEFLKRPDAVQDNSYGTIKSIYEAVAKVAIHPPNPNNGQVERSESIARPNSQKKRKKKKAAEL
jgi:hypothetical protein